MRQTLFAATDLGFDALTRRPARRGAALRCGDRQRVLTYTGICGAQLGAKRSFKALKPAD